MSFKSLGYSVEGAVATVILQRPERQNRLSPELVNELLHAFARAREDDAVRVVVLAAQGKVFCAGGDLGQMAGGSSGEDGELPLRGDFADLMLAMVRMDKPLVARVHGPAMGGGVGLLAACHFALAAQEVTIGLPELNVGLFPMMIMAVLARTMPRRALLEMMLLAQKLDADSAVRVGLLNRAVPAAELDAAVGELARSLAQRAPVAMRRGLAAYGRLGDQTMQEALPALRDELYALLGTEDAREGLLAFMEKRSPQWSGK